MYISVMAVQISDFTILRPRQLIYTFDMCIKSTCHHKNIFPFCLSRLFYHRMTVLLVKFNGQNLYFVKQLAM